MDDWKLDFWNRFVSKNALSGFDVGSDDDYEHNESMLG